MDKKIIFIFLFLFSLTFISASFGYDTAEVIDSEVTVNTYTGNITNLSEMQDVDVAGVDDDDVLTYNSATGKWEDQPPALGSETDPKWTANYSDFLTVFAWNDTGLIRDWNSSSLIIDWNASGYLIDWSYLGGGVSWADVVNGTVYLSSNPFGFYNTTDFDISNYLNSTYTLGNITSANTSLYDWVVAQGYTADGITWANAINGTLFTTALYNTNYTANDEAYRSITNTSYYLAANPFGFYNSTDFDIDDYLLESNTTLVGNYSASLDFCISGGACLSGVSAGGEPLWNANYSTFLTHITWSEAINGTLFLTSDWNTNYTANNDAWLNTTNLTYDAYNSSGLIIDWNSTGLIINWSGDYVTLAQLLGFSYYNATDFNITDYILYSGATANVDLGIYNITGGWFKGKFNWTEISKYLSFDGITLDFNETELNSTIDLRTISNYYNASLISTISGTLDGGNLASIIFPEDDDTYNVSEDVGADPLIIAINFSNVDSFDSIVGRIYYDGGLGHEVQLEIQRSDTGAWENYIDLTDTTDFVNIYVPVFDPELHVFGNGDVAIRFNHVQTGIPSHNFYIDYLTIVDGWTTLTVADHDALGGRDSISNHPWALPTNGSLRNASSVIVTGNVTASYFLGNGSQLTDITLTESDPYWTANFTLYNSTWSSMINTSYYLATNPFTFWNSTFATFNKTYADTLYYGLSNPFGFYNSTDFDITDYLNLTTLLSFGYYNSTDFDISDYYSKTDIDGFSYYNATNFDIADYSTTATILGWSYYNSTDFSIGNYRTLVNNTFEADIDLQDNNLIDVNDIGTATDEIDDVYVGTNQKIYFGDGQESSIYFNGTHMIFD